MQKNEACGRRCDREFKNNAVGLVHGGKSLRQVSRDLGVSQWSVGRWVVAANGGQAQREPATLAAESEEAREVRRLRQENDSLRAQRDLLKRKRGAACQRRAPGAAGAAGAAGKKRGRRGDGVAGATARTTPGWRAAKATLKAECFYGERPATRQAATLQIFDCVEGS